MANQYQQTFDKKYLVEIDDTLLSDAIIKRKLKDLNERVNWFDFLIRERNSIASHNIFAIEQDIMSVNNRLAQVAVMWGHDPEEVSSLEKAVFDLENQKRNESASCWRDLWQVKKELLELGKEQQSLKRISELTQ